VSDARVQQCSATEAQHTTLIRHAVDADTQHVYRLGGMSAIGVGVGYVLIIPLYVSVGPPPVGGEPVLPYLDGKTTSGGQFLGSPS
jgi:hypothetical protein